MKHQVLMLRTKITQQTNLCRTVGRIDISNLRNWVNIVEYDETADVCLNATRSIIPVHEMCVDSVMGN